MKMHKTLFFFIAALAIPCSAAYPVIQEMQTVLDNVSRYAPVEANSGKPVEVSSTVAMPRVLPSGDTDALEQLLSAQTSADDETFHTEIGEGEQNQALEGQISGPQGIPFWRRPSVFISGTLLMGFGILFAILGAASGGGSSSGNGSDGGPQQDFLNNPGGGNPDEGSKPDDFLLLGGGKVPNGSGDENRIPSNPEPATVFLLASGIGLAFLRRKHKYTQQHHKL